MKVMVGDYLSLLFLGLSIQFELFFIYLIPVGVIAWFILRPKMPTIKNIFILLFVLLQHFQQ
jgi:hypothetical protein